MTWKPRHLYYPAMERFESKIAKAKLKEDIAIILHWYQEQTWQKRDDLQKLAWILITIYQSMIYFQYKSYFAITYLIPKYLSW